MTVQTSQVSWFIIPTRHSTKWEGEGTVKVDSGFNFHLTDEVEISKSAYIFILACDFSHVHVALRNSSPVGICTNAACPAEWDVKCGWLS